MLVSEFLTRIASETGRADWVSDTTQPFRILMDAIRYLRSACPLHYDSYNVMSITLSSGETSAQVITKPLATNDTTGRPGDIVNLVKDVYWVKTKDSDGKYSNDLIYLDYGDFRTLYYDIDSTDTSAVGDPAYYSMLTNPEYTGFTIYVGPKPEDDTILVIAYKGNPRPLEEYDSGWQPNTDTTNSWLELYPHVVVQAFKYFYELEMRNDNGAEMYLKHTNILLRGVDRDVAEWEDPGNKEMPG